MKAKKKTLSVEELAKKYEKFIKNKEVNPNGKELFDKTLKKALTKQSRKNKK